MDIEDDIEQPWWRSFLRVLGIVSGLALLVGGSMAFIFFVANYASKGDSKQPMPVFIDASTPPPPAYNNARTRPPPEIEWPDHPGRGAAVSFKGGRGDGGERMRGGGGPGQRVAASTPDKPVPVGISDERYREVVDNGKKVYLPSPKGDCDISGQNLTQSTSALDSCFARQAAR